MRIVGLGDIDDVISRATQRSLPVLASCCAKIKAHVETASSLATAKANADGWKLPLDKFRTIAYEEMLVSDLYARLEALTEDFKIELAESIPWSKVQPDLAIEAFKKKQVMTPKAFKKLDDAYKLKSFTVSSDLRLYMLDKVKDDLTAAIEEGTTRQAFVKLMGERFDAWGVTRLKPYHADTVFNTNVLGSYAHGRYEQLTDPDVVSMRPYWQYKTVGDGRVRPTHAAMNGKVYPQDSPVWNTWFPPAGFNSILPSQRVSGRAIMALKASYAGPAVEVIGKSGGRFSVTAKHPVLTRRGWVDADALRQGDELVAYRGDVGCGSPSADFHENDLPPTIEDAFVSFGDKIPVVIPRAAIYLNGDIEFIEGDVHVVTINRELMLHVKATIAQTLDEFKLSRAREPFRSVAASSPLASVDRDQRSSAASDRGNAAQPVGTIFAHHHGESIGLDPALSEKSSDLLPALVETGCKLSQGNPRLVQLDHLWWHRFSLTCTPGDVSFFGSGQAASLALGSLGRSTLTDVFFGGSEANPNAMRDIIDRHSAFIEFDDVLDIRHFDFVGHVYDLQTKSGLILAHGGNQVNHELHYAVSNCRCSVISLTGQQAKEMGVEEGMPSVEPDQGFATSPADWV